MILIVSMKRYHTGKSEESENNLSDKRNYSTLHICASVTFFYLEIHTYVCNRADKTIKTLSKLFL